MFSKTKIIKFPFEAQNILLLIKLNPTKIKSKNKVIYNVINLNK